MTDATVENFRVCVPSAPMKAAPHQDAECTNECLYGERVQCVSTIPVGGCSPKGLDCSGLVQALARAKGLFILRDSGDQEQDLKNTIAVGQQCSQDLVYWPGHTGILLDADTLLHAPVHSLSCVVEPLQDVVQRAGEISCIKRCLINPAAHFDFAVPLPTGHSGSCGLATASAHRPE